MNEILIIILGLSFWVQVAAICVGFYYSIKEPCLAWRFMLIVLFVPMFIYIPYVIIVDYLEGKNAK